MKRIFDFIFSFLALSLLSPAIAVVAAIVKFTSRGPAVLVQRRVGCDGREFAVYKFRTMVENAPSLGTSVTVSGDPRITPLGTFLRKTKLDELPQLFNVLKGDMSLVGPRPDVPEIVAKYTPEMRRVLSVKPGITSLATLHFRNEEEVLAKVPDPDEFYGKVVVPLKVKLALEHVDRNSFWFDLRVLLQTVWMITPLRRIYSIKEHPLVTGMKQALN